MIKLKDLLKESKVWERKFGEPLPTLDSVMKKHQENKLKEEKTFKAKSKETGRVVVYKSKDSMDKAIKDKRAEPLDKKKTTTKGASLFKKDVQKKKTKATDSTELINKIFDKQVLAKKKLQSQLSKAENDALNKKTDDSQGVQDKEKIAVLDKLSPAQQKAAGYKLSSSNDLYYPMEKIPVQISQDEKDILNNLRKKAFFGVDDKEFTALDKLSPEQLKAIGYERAPGRYGKYARYKKIKPEKSEVPKVSTVKVSKQAVKSVSDLSNEIEKNIDDAYEDLDSDKRDDFTITLQNVGTTLEEEVDYDDLSDEDKKEFDEIFDEIEQQVSHLQNDESGMGSIEGDPRTTSKRAVKFINKFSTKNEGMIKLKTLLKETKVWERKFGEPLPTLDSVMRKHQQSSKPINEAKGWRLLNNIYLKFTQHHARKLELAIRKKDITLTNSVIDTIIDGLESAKRHTKKDRATL